MPNPKRRHSKTRRDKRRTHWKLSTPAVMECPNCNETKRPHSACPNCGYYNGRSVFSPKTSS
ncbi:50S ribosomal protein L32 [candidate division KSB1 bacterium]|nr:50S ribosomal protein L32 [candidate division KSB1 bacterium]